MEELFSQLIRNFHRFSIPKPTKREIAFPSELVHLRKAWVFIGMRRSGKTWAMFQKMHELMEEGIDQKQMVYINFEDERLQDVTSRDLSTILDAYFSLYPEKIEDKNIHFFFDEIHEVVGWEKFIRRLLDTEEIQLYLTGSSAKMLSKEIATSLRGRTIVREIFPYNFREYCAHRKIAIPNHPSTKELAAQMGYLRDFLRWGGFPETVGVSSEYRREILQSYVDSVIYRDIVDRYQIANTTALKRLILYCLQNAASPFSVHKMYHAFKSLGVATSKNSLYEYMHYLEDAYCIFSTTLFHPSLRKQEKNPKKIYPVDQGLITAFGWHEEFCQGIRLETAVFLSLIRQQKICHYYLTKEGYEIDFVGLDPMRENVTDLIQVSLSLKDEATRKREIRALCAAKEELGIDRATIVTLDESSPQKDGVEVLSFREFFL